MKLSEFTDNFVQFDLAPMMYRFGLFESTGDVDKNKYEIIHQVWADLSGYGINVT